MTTQALEMDSFWVNKNEYADAEKQYYEGLVKLPNCKGLLSRGDSSNGSGPRQEEAQSPMSCIAGKKVSVCESDSNKENISGESPDTPKSNVKKIKSQKCILSNDESEWITVCSKSELKEKNSKRNKKSKEHAREMTPSSVSNKDAAPPTSPKEDATTPAATVCQTQPPADASCKKKDGKEKANKAEKKRNKKEKEAKEKMDAAEKVEELPKAAADKLTASAPSVVSGQGESTQVVSGQCSLSHEIAKARQHIKNSLECMDTVMASVPSMEVVNRISALESAMADMRNLVLRVQNDVNTLMKHIPLSGAKASSVSPAKPVQAKAPALAPAPAPSQEDSDDGVDLFDSDSEDDAAAAKIREERLAQYAAKKSKKPALIAKSSIILDVKPWDDETDMNEMERLVRLIATDGLLWGASKFVLLAYGIKKLQINCVVEDEKVSIDWLQEEIEKLEDLVQSVDIAAFNKI